MTDTFAFLLSNWDVITLLITNIAALFVDPKKLKERNS